MKMYTLPINNYADVKEFSKIKNLTAHDWHIYWAFHDPELIRENHILNTQYRVATYIKNRGYWDNKYLSKDKLVPFRKAQDKLAKKYCLTRMHIDMLNTKPLVYYRPQSKILNFNYNQDNDVFKFEVEAGITKEDFLKGYEILQKLIKLRGVHIPGTRRKEPLYPNLTYAVFKARQRGMHYKDIFALYEQNTLPYYTYSDKTTELRFIAQDDLEHYYNRYRPDKHL